MVGRKVEINRRYNVDGLVERYLARSGVRDIVKRRIKGANNYVCIYIYETYNYRVSSNLSVTIITAEGKEKSSAEIIASGGGSGMLELDFGSEDAAMNGLLNCLLENGFVLAN